MTLNALPLYKNPEHQQNFYTKLLLRIRILQFLIIITIFFLIVIPTFTIIQFILNSGRLSITSNNVLIATLLPLASIVFFTILLIVGVFNSRLLWFYKAFILLYVVDLIFSESNPFLIVLKFALALFLYEIPFITQYYSFFMKKYKNSQSNYSFELGRLQILFDEHITYILALCAVIISLTWFFIIILENVQLDIGDKASIVFPIILMLLCMGIFYTRPEFSRTLSKRQFKKVKQVEKESTIEKDVSNNKF